jgi:SAM-dependent methyltransferase
MPISQQQYNEARDQFLRRNQATGRFPQFGEEPKFHDVDSEHDCSYLYLQHIAWATKVLLRTKPAHHYDFGSFLYWAGCAAQICPLTFCDIRPMTDVAVPGMTSKGANLTQLPFEKDSLASISCLHVMEHVGLGRYGDPLDFDGDKRAALELSRVLLPGGQLLMVLPVGAPKLVFNAHRIYSYQMVLDLFPDLKLQEFTLCAPPEYIENANPDRVQNLNEGAGCFLFTK